MKGLMNTQLGAVMIDAEVIEDVTEPTQEPEAQQDVQMALFGK